MILRYLDNGILIVRRFSISFILKLSNGKDLLLFNCIDGCQSNIFSQKFKISHLTKIIITDLNVNNISGLLGLLSSLNLTGRLKALHIYAPINLIYYLDLGRKYSQTNFSYPIYVHILRTGIVINEYGLRLYTFINQNRCEFVTIQPEQYGTFLFNQAKNNYLIPGPLYGKLKKGSNFIFPDGFILDGSKLTSRSIYGKRLYLSSSFYYYRKILENSIRSRIVLLA
uniref:Ribonuclease Z n=1 Tax=Dasyclonium flaccidum TaxID=2007274 RepID=A0A1Z1MKH2_9FLOR|nr:ribonuclease Z [Dasyclonium flaccidum]ARW66548.1 ribonuclease Z [Dasyclonium flaccidum]